MSHIEFTHGQNTYRAGKLPAMTQLHVVRRLAPFLSALMGALPGGQAQTLLKAAKEGDETNGKAEAAQLGLAAIGPLLDAVAAMPDEQVDYVINACLSVVERRQSAGGWAPVMSSGGLMFEDLGMVDLLGIARHVLSRDLAGFFGGGLQAFAAGGRT